jgi:D-3-phosphoglycerate dehydrogenase
MSDVRVLITCPQMQNCVDQFRERFEQQGIAIELPDVVQQPTEDELIAIIGDFDGMIAGDDPLTARVLEHATRMRIISKWGVGTDGIDFEAAREHGIRVTNTPGVFGDDVADLAAGYLVMLARQLHRIDASVRSGGWFKFEGQALSGKTLGVVGFGSIGQAVARRGHGFGMRVIAHDVMPASQALDVELLALDRVLTDADFLVLCAPLTPATRHMIDARALALMRTGAFLINVSRGPLVDERALAAALTAERLAGAALDVFEEEPLGPGSPLLGFEQCIFGSHNGSNTREGVLRASAVAVTNVLEGLARVA